MNKTISPDDLNLLIKNNEVIVIDVREPSEYEAGHIAGSTLVPIGGIQNYNVPKNKKIVVHCLFGKRGGRACQILCARFPNLEIYNLEGGLTAWREAGYEVTK